MYRPRRLIEIGGAKRPIRSTGLEKYVGIDPLYADQITRIKAEEFLTGWGVQVTLLAERVQAVDVLQVSPAELVIMQNVLGNKERTDRLDTVRNALRFVAERGRLVVIENITPSQAGLPEIEDAMEADGYFVATLGAAQSTFRNAYEDLGLGDPARTYKMMIISHPNGQNSAHTPLQG